MEKMNFNSTKYHMFLLVVIIGLFGSCKVSYYAHTDSVIPPVMPLPEDIKTVKLIDRTPVKSISARLRKLQATGYFIGDQMKTSRADMLRELAFRMSAEGTVHTQSFKDGKEDSPAKTLTPEEVKNLAITEDAILSLEKCLVRRIDNYEKFNKHQLDSLGNDYTVSAFHGILESRIETHWRLYDASSGKVLMNFPKHIVDITEAEGLTIPQTSEKLNASAISPKLQAKNLGRFLGEDMSPKYIKSNWMYYKKGSPTIISSADHINNGRFMEALHLIESNSSLKSNIKTKERLQYNQVICYWLSGNSEKALLLAKQYDSKISNNEFGRFIMKAEQY
jgi:hypothetical protein